jgi:hypothetical protein
MMVSPTDSDVRLCVVYTHPFSQAATRVSIVCSQSDGSVAIGDTIQSSMSLLVDVIIAVCGLPTLNLIFVISLPYGPCLRVIE